MAFAKKLANAGLLGIPGLVAGAALGKDKKKDNPKPQSSLMTENYTRPVGSLISRNY
jgi:hypothetical protein